MSADPYQTWRGQYDGVCFQKLQRDEAASSEDADILFPSPDPEHLTLKKARVRECSRAVAKKIILRYEWLGTLPMANRFFGVFFDDIYCGGVACYSIGSAGAGGSSITKWLGCDQTDIAYLCRGACVHWAPKGAAPKLINWSAKLTNCQVALAYSDTDAGEIGTVYQAAGWECLGRGQRVEQYVSPDGRVSDCRIIGLTAKRIGVTWKQSKEMFLRAGWKVQQSNPKYRYVKVLPRGRRNEHLLALIERERVPYPKRPPQASEA